MFYQKLAEWGQQVADVLHGWKALPFRSMTVFNFLLESTLAGSLLILMVLILRQVFRKKIGSRRVYLAWMLVAIRLLVPLALPNPLMDELRPTFSEDAGARPVADQVRVRFNDAMSDVSYQLSEAAFAHDSQAEQTLADATQWVATYTSYGWLGKGFLAVYGAGALLVCMVFVLRHLRFRRELKRRAVGGLEGEQLALYQALCSQLKLKPLPVVLADPLSSPCLVGVLRPMIALPVLLPQEALKEALLHELQHAKTRDPWWVLLRSLCCAVHWFNPLVWVAQRYVRMDCELACDERVSAILNEEERRHYATTLVTTAKRAYVPRSGVLTTGMTMTGKRLKRRVESILHRPVVRRGASAAVAVVLVCMTVAAFSTAESVDQTRRLSGRSATAYPLTAIDAAALLPAEEVGVALTELDAADKAIEQAKRYLLALFPAEQAAIEGQYLIEARTFGRTAWEVLVYPSAEGGELCFYMELTSSGRLTSVSRRDVQAGEAHQNLDTLPAGTEETILALTQRISQRALQGAQLDMVTSIIDQDDAAGRYLYCDLRSSADSGVSAMVDVQIAPVQRLISVFYESGEQAKDIAAASTVMTYTADPSITFDGWNEGFSDSYYTLEPNSVLTVQQAFDLAVGAVLARDGLDREKFLRSPMRYGFIDKSKHEGGSDMWRFWWRVSSADADMFFVDFADVAEPDINVSFPGEGVG